MENCAPSYHYNNYARDSTIHDGHRRPPITRKVGAATCMSPSSPCCAGTISRVAPSTPISTECQAQHSFSKEPRTDQKISPPPPRALQCATRTNPTRGGRAASRYCKFQPCSQPSCRALRTSQWSPLGLGQTLHAPHRLATSQTAALPSDCQPTASPPQSLPA